MNHINIHRTFPEVAFRDVMDGSTRWDVPVHAHGMVSLVDVMPRLVPVGHTADSAIVQAARVAYGHGTKQQSEDQDLIRYLVRHRHTTPLEMVEFKFHCAMPIFVARQWIRHRTANVNEYSARYSVVKDRFYRPTADGIRKQSRANKQGGDDPVDAATAEGFLAYLEQTEQAQYAGYQAAVDAGIARELARIALPLSAYTEWYWKIDLHNLFHFLSLRMEEHAQQEIRDYAHAMYALIEPIVPRAARAWLDYQFGSVRLSALEVHALKTGGPLPSDNKREQAEWAEKRRVLGLDPEPVEHD